MFWSVLRMYRGRNNPIGRVGFKKALIRGRAQKSPEILLPPYISIQELRLMLNSDYISCFRSAKVSISKRQYTWSDSHGRTFQTSNKRNVIIPYETSSYLSKMMRFKPIKVDPEPVIPKSKSVGIPIIAVVGHHKHGKTTLINNITGTKFHNTGVTSITGVTVCDCDGRFTYLDTPGDVNFEVLRGRAIHVSDLCVIVISSEGPETVTRDVILQVNKFNTPAIFCITKSDLHYNNVDIIKSELSLQLNLLLQAGLIHRNFTQELDNAVIVSSYDRSSIDTLKEVIKRKLREITPGHTVIDKVNSVENFEKYVRRSNSLVGSKVVKGVGFILEVTKSQSHGIVLNVIVTFGTITHGNYFVAGTSYGRVSSLLTTNSLNSVNSGNTTTTVNTINSVNSVNVGMVVGVTGLRSLDGVGVDDELLVMSQHDAFRLSQYRKQIQTLKSSQIKGPEINTPWNTTLHEYPNVYNNQLNVTNGTVEQSVDTVPVDPVAPLDRVETTVAPVESLESSIYLKPLEEDEWTLNAKLHNQQLHQRWHHKYANNSHSIHSVNTSDTVDNSDKVDKVDKVDTVDTLDTVEIVDKVEIVDNTTLNTTPGKVVVPVILRANYLGVFESLLDGIEELERELGVRIPLVHGGIGPVIPSDIVQAQIGNKFTFCPVYSFQVPIHTDAAKHAIINKVVIKSFNQHADLLNDIRQRCNHTLKLQ